jgi:hypothetical protein
MCATEAIVSGIADCRRSRAFPLGGTSANCYGNGQRRHRFTGRSSEPGDEQGLRGEFQQQQRFGNLRRTTLIGTTGS